MIGVLGLGLLAFMPDKPKFAPREFDVRRPQAFVDRYFAEAGKPAEGEKTKYASLQEPLTIAAP